MSTHGVIARPKGDEWEGRYHHWDSMPSQLGRCLWRLVQSWGVETARRVLIDEHTAWSTIVAPGDGVDWSRQPGYPTETEREEYARPGGTRLPRPQCYCHGAHSEGEEGRMEEREDETCCKWTYVLGELVMVIERRVDEAWVTLPPIPWRAPEPDWKAIEDMALGHR